MDYGKFKKLNDGALISDVSLAEGGYNYYGFLRMNGEWIIQRENVAGTEYRYRSGNGVGANTYAAAWTARTTIVYKKVDGSAS